MGWAGPLLRVSLEDLIYSKNLSSDMKVDGLEVSENTQPKPRMFRGQCHPWTKIRLFQAMQTLILCLIRKNSELCTFQHCPVSIQHSVSANASVDVHVLLPPGILFYSKF